MAEKFYVVEKRSVKVDYANKDPRYQDGFVTFGGPLESESEARKTAHSVAFQSPGRTFTIIKIVGHAIADLVRDLEP